MKVVNRLKEVRKRAKLPLVALSIKSGTSAATLSAIEKWNYSPGPEVKEKVAKALGVQVADVWPESKGGAE